MSIAVCQPFEEVAPVFPTIDDVNESAAEDIAILKDWCLEQADGWYARKELVPAKDFLQHAAGIDPKDFHVWIALGSIEYELKNFRNAVIAFVNAGHIQPMSAQPFMHLALAHVGLGHAEDAENLFRHAVALEPENELANSLLEKFLTQKSLDGK